MNALTIIIIGAVVLTLVASFQLVKWFTKPAKPAEPTKPVKRQIILTRNDKKDHDNYINAHVLKFIRSTEAEKLAMLEDLEDQRAITKKNKPLDQEDPDYDEDYRNWAIETMQINELYSKLTDYIY